jgi:hypothetical protein
MMLSLPARAHVSVTWLSDRNGDPRLLNSNLVPIYLGEKKSLPDVWEENMELILIVLVLFLLFGGGGYWGYRRWR